MGEEATAETIRQLLPDFTRIHLAIHGIAYEQMPLASVLCLQDKPLSLYELFGMNMAAELVVLSACRTGTGTITRGGEVFSFARGLLAAGAKAVVVSLWPVDDTATALFMVEFYRQLAADKSAAEALQLAHQLRALARGEVTERSTADVTAPQSFPLFADTYYWAPFVLIGS